MELIPIVLEFLKSNYIATNIYSLTMIIMVIGLFVKFVIMPLYKHIYLPVREFITGLMSAINKVEFLEKEFKPNDGSSLKDVMSRIDTQVSTINSYIIKIGSKQDAVFQFLGMGADGFAFFEFDKNGECIFASPKFCEMCGLLEEEVLGMGWISAIHNEDRDRVYNEWKTCVTQHRSIVLNYRIYNRRNKQTSSVLCYAVPIRADSDVISYLGTLRECRE